MSVRYYNPFATLFFDSHTCFLTGENLPDDTHKMSVFPSWVLTDFGYNEKRFKLMDFVSSIGYYDLQLPCTTPVKEAFQQLDEEVYKALQKGRAAVEALDDHRLFLWMGKIVYGILYHDLLLEKQKCEKWKKPFGVAPRLKERLSVFHLMLQSLVKPLHFVGEKPWSITVVSVKYSKEVFNYRDDTIQLMFALGMNGVGVIACLQDNGLVKKEQQDILQKIGDMVLHPIQFEELCARYFYSNYLLQPQPAYVIENREQGMTLTTPKPAHSQSTPLFGVWDDAIFAKVLTDYWSPWGFTRKQIHDFPDPPISFLENQTDYSFITPDQISLPY